MSVTMSVRPSGERACATAWSSPIWGEGTCCCLELALLLALGLAHGSQMDLLTS